MMTTLADIQRRVGVTPDGLWGPATASAILAALPPVQDDSAITIATGLIKSFEGCKLTAYPDPGSGGDPWTVGFGSTGPDIHRGTVWTLDQATARLTADVAKFAEGVSKLIGPATAHQRAAMISLAYNIGLGNFQTSTLRRLHNEGDYVGAKAQFARWDKASGRVLAGLTKRRAAEAAEYGA